MEDTTRHSHLSGILNPIVLWTYLRRLNIPQWLNIYLAISVSFNAFRILSRILQYMKKKIGTVSFRFLNKDGASILAAAIPQTEKVSWLPLKGMQRLELVQEIVTKDHIST